jgi:acyl-CoA thioesterase-1
MDGSANGKVQEVNNGETMTPKTLLALGDSLTAGWGLTPDQAFPTLLEKMLAEDGCSVRIINAGVSGDTSTGGLTRLPWLLSGPADERSDMALVALGANDGLRGIDPAVMEESLSAILERLKQDNIPTLLAGMLAPPNFGAEYAETFNAVFPRLAERYGVTLYPFILEGVATRPELNQPDGIHPNAAGAEEIAKRLYPLVRDLAAQVGACSDSDSDPGN